MSSSAASAEDITQDVFVALLRHPDRFNPARGSLRAFLLGIARNLALKRWRAEGAGRRWEALDDEQFVAPPLNIEQSEIGELVGRAVRSLPPLQREVVILAEYEELSLADIAGIVDAEIGTVKSRLHRARENLRTLLAPLRVNAHGTHGRP
jgi:RNA polymerase sigma-70 factor (ECF subfamily)